MTSTATNAAQNELFSAETTWFHIFRTMIANGDMAKMGPHAFATYCVIKAHTNFSTGRSFPSLELIAEKTGISLAQVKREYPLHVRVSRCGPWSLGRSHPDRSRAMGLSDQRT